MPQNIFANPWQWCSILILKKRFSWHLETATNYPNIQVLPKVQLIKLQVENQLSPSSLGDLVTWHMTNSILFVEQMIHSQRLICLLEILKHNNFDAQYHRSLAQKYWWMQTKCEPIWGPEKSFDTVDHDILLSKLSAPGVTKKAHCCFTSYLKTEHESAPQEAQIVAFLKDLVRSSYYFSYT